MLVPYSNTCTPQIVETDHRLELRDHRFPGAAEVLVAVAQAQRVGLLRGEPGGDVRQRIVARAHLGHDVRPPAAFEHRREHLGRVPDQPDPDRPAFVTRLLGQRDRLLKEVAITSQKPFSIRRSITRRSASTEMHTPPSIVIALVWFPPMPPGRR